MRVLVFYLLLLLTQGFLGALMSPLPSPDLFLVAVLTLMWRVTPWQLVLIGYGVGLLQDIVGHGVLGLHAFSLAGSALVASFLRAQLSQSGVFERLLVVLAAVAGKWLVMSGMVLWLSGSFDALGRVPLVVIFDAAFTLFVSVWMLPWADALFERASVLRKELL